MLDEKIEIYGIEPKSLFVYRNIILPCLFLILIFNICVLIFNHSTAVSLFDIAKMIIILIAIASCYILFSQANKVAWYVNISCILLFITQVVFLLVNQLKIGPEIDFYLNNPLDDKTGLNRLMITLFYWVKIIGMFGILLFVVFILIQFIRHRRLFLWDIHSLENFCSEEDDI